MRRPPRTVWRAWTKRPVTVLKDRCRGLHGRMRMAVHLHQRSIDHQLDGHRQVVGVALVRVGGLAAAVRSSVNLSDGSHAAPSLTSSADWGARWQRSRLADSITLR